MSEANRPADAAAADLPPDLAELRAQLEQAAVQRLAATRSFPPFGLAMLPDGNVIDYSVSVPAEKATPELIYNVLVKGLRGSARQHKFRAVGLCHTIVKDNGHHAIRLLFEPRSGLTVELTVPFLIGIGRTPTLAAAEVAVAKATVFIDDEAF
jgi:hypothetical protein